MSNTPQPLNVMTMGGGNGQQALLSGLRDLSGISITAVVSMVDSGGSTGRLRNELSALPPGDVLKCIVALSPHHETSGSFLQRRFLKDPLLKGHNAGNMLLTMLSRYTGSFPSGVAALAEIMESKGTILPVTTDKATLVAELSDGARVYGESAIDLPGGNQRERIRDVFLVPHHNDKVHVFPPVVEAIQEADYIILGPGDLYTSIIPNLIVPGVSDAIAGSGAQLIHIVNIMTKYGETHQFKSDDFVRKLERFTRKPIDVVVHNNRKPSRELCDLYRRQKSEYVKADTCDQFWDNRRLYPADLLSCCNQTIRHDSQKLASLLQSIFSSPSARKI